MKYSVMRFFTFAALIGLALFLVVSCGDDDKKVTSPSTDTTGQPVSQLIRSDEAGTVSHPEGSSIYVPQGAVPSNQDGEDGEMIFTIEVGNHGDFGVPNTPPENWEFVGKIHSMGPDGFIFRTPITTTLPIPSDIDLSEKEVCMFDYNHEDGIWESVGQSVNEDGTALSADCLHLCANVILARNITGRGPGSIRFDAINRYSFKICIESYTLLYPEWDASFQATNRFRSINRRGASTTPPDGRMYWTLPQGTYTLSIAVYQHPEDLSQPPTYLGYFQRQIALNRPHWDWENDGPDYEFAVPFGDFVTDPAQLIPERPACMGIETPSVGVGAINVRLEWNAHADLDLWVVDPCDNKIYYYSPLATCQESGGRLDLDNYCGNFVFGRPENIFWKDDPPSGTYKVYVDYYGDCSEAGNVFYTVRRVVNGTARTTRGEISPPASSGADGDEVLVTTFQY